MTESRSRAPSAWLLAALALAVVGIVALVVVFTGQESPPRPSPAATGTTTSAPPAAGSDPGPPPSPSGTPTPEAAPVAEPVAEPVSVSVPAIGVTSELMDLGLNDDGTVEVPPLGPDDQAGWYEPGPAPGAVGPAVILGHVDSAEHGPGIFFELGALSPGDPIEVARADGTVAVFAVDRVEVHPKAEFPTIEVYGNTTDPQLRLITCGGDFDSSVRSYEDNVIVFATLQETRAA